MRILLQLLPISLFAAGTLTGCTAKQDVAPSKAACGTAATVRFCLGKTAFCPTKHTTLVLADGTRLQPSGPDWDAYLPHQVDGQTLYINYSVTGPATEGAPADVSAALSCLTAPTR